MRCFYHQETEAVGVCKNCGKGLCSSCAVDLVDGLACKDRCEAKALALIDCIKATLSWRSEAVVGGILLAVGGIGVLVYGAFEEAGSAPSVFFLAVIGSFLLVWAISLLWWAFRGR